MSMFTRKNPRVVKPEKLEFQYTVYLVTSGEVGTFYNDRLDKPAMFSLSERGGQEMISIGQNLAQKHLNDKIAVWCASDFDHDKIAALLLAEGLGAQLGYLPEGEMIEHEMLEPSRRRSHLAERLRVEAEINGTTVFVILVSPAYVAPSNPIARGSKGGCFGFTATSQNRRQPIILKPIPV